MRATDVANPNATPGLLTLVVRGLEALEGGDSWLVREIFKELELRLLSEGGMSRSYPYRCRRCSARFEWPGLLADHRYRVHMESA
jgi:hypothetical protein